MVNYSMKWASDCSEAEDIMRCLRTLLNIRAGTQPADRELGISWECLDQLPETAEALFIVELEDKVAKYEPRAEILEVTFSYSETGIMIPHIIFGKKV
ncbi:MAG: GPW/gp25 family protein [Lachnospiraceae bacterium]|nr:GPW/gp25 family protein [Lachnospiraceae bacterium]